MVLDTVLNFIMTNPWVIFVVSVLLAMLVAKIVSVIVTRLVLQIQYLTKNERNIKIIKQFENPIVFLIGLIVVRSGIVLSNIPIQRVSTMRLVIASLMILTVARIVFLVIALLLELWFRETTRIKKTELDEDLIKLCRRASGILFYSFAFLYIFHVWNIDIVPILGSLGIAGLALAFALQETLKNLFGGVALVLDKNIKTGDIVELPDGRSGMVYDMSLRSTRIKTWDNRLIIIPNSNMANDIITNISRPDKSRRVDVLFSVAYGTDPSYVKHIVLNEIKKIPDILQDPEPRVVFNDMGNSSLDFVARYWVSESKFFLAAKEAGTIAIYDLLNKENISIPFPQREVWVHNMGKHTAKKYAKKKIPQQTTTRSKKKRVSKK